jgi:hypothetical protein
MVGAPYLEGDHLMYVIKLVAQFAIYTALPALVSLFLFRAWGLSAPLLRAGVIGAIFLGLQWVSSMFLPDFTGGSSSVWFDDKSVPHPDTIVLVVVRYHRNEHRYGLGQYDNGWKSREGQPIIGNVREWAYLPDSHFIDARRDG